MHRFEPLSATRAACSRVSWEKSNEGMTEAEDDPPARLPTPPHPAPPGPQALCRALRCVICPRVSADCYLHLARTPHTFPHFDPASPSLLRSCFTRPCLPFLHSGFPSTLASLGSVVRGSKNTRGSAFPVVGITQHALKHRHTTTHAGGPSAVLLAQSQHAPPAAAAASRAARLRG